MPLGMAFVVLAAAAWGCFTEGYPILGVFCVVGAAIGARWIIKIGWSDR